MDARYPKPFRVVFNDGPEYKRDFIPLFRDFNIKPFCTTVEKPQANVPIKQVYKVINNIIFTKDIKTRSFEHINTWGEIITSVAWSIIASHHSTFGASTAQLVFGRGMIFNLASLIE